MALTKDPATGIFSDTGTPSLGSLAPTTGFNSTVFSQRVADMLTQLQDTQQTGAKNLGGAANTLTTESIGAGGAYNPLNTPEGNIANVSGAQNAFTPAITSINTQLENANTASKLAQGNISILKDVFKPEQVVPGNTLVTPQGDVIYQGHAYTPQIRLDTGTQDSYDSTTGQWLSDVKSKNNSTNPPSAAKPGQNMIVAGIDFSGKSTGVGAYATDPNYSNEVNGIYNDIEKNFPTPTSQNLQSYIENNAGKNKSPVTGQMIINAATTYGVDPNALTAVLNQESDFGTAGVATRTMNPGNVGNTGSAERSFNSWQAGVNATAQELARRMTGNVHAPIPTSTATSPIGGTFSPEATQKINQLPDPYHQYIDAGPKGVAYIDASRVPDVLKPSLQILSSKQGIPMLDSNEVNNVKGIGIVYDSMKKLQGLVSKALGTGASGRLKGLTLNQIEQSTQTGAGPFLKQFDQYRSQAINNLKALTAGGTTFRITQTEIDTAVGNIPSSADNQETAAADLQTLQSFMDSKLASTFPYTQGGQPGATTPSDINSLRAKYKY